MARLTGPACRAARALLGWSLRDLRDASGVALATLTALENGQDHRASTADRIVEAFSEHGVEITNGDSTGAKLRLGMDRSEAAEAFEQMVDDYAFARPPRADWRQVLNAVAVRVGGDIIPGKPARVLADDSEAREPTHYRDAVPMLRQLIEAREAGRAL